MIVLGVFWLCIWPIRVSSVSVLSFGDSVDRQLSEDWCSGNNLTLALWGEREGLRYHGHVGDMLVPSSRCVNVKLNDSISVVHLYGSAMKGPYFHGLISTPEDPFKNTDVRVKKAWQVYSNDFGHPDFISVQTEQWDIQAINQRRGMGMSNDGHTNAFETNLNVLLDLILNVTGINTYSIILRTAVWNEKGGVLLRAFNDAVRRVSQKRRMILYDADLDIWGIVNGTVSEDYHLFRDWIHPNHILCMRMAEKVLGIRYTNFLINHSDSKPSALKDGVKFSLVSDSFGHDSVYFVERFNDTLMKLKVRDDLLKYLYLGPGDVFVHENITKSIINHNFVNLVNDLLGDGSRKLVYCRAECIHFYCDDCSFILEKTRFLRRIFERETFIFHNTSLPLASIVDMEILQYLRHDADLPNVYKNDALFRFHTSKQVYVFLNGTKFAIPDVGTFLARGYDFTNVITLFHTADLDIIPDT